MKKLKQYENSLSSVSEVASFFHVISDKTRIRILVLLKDNELCVCQLMGALGMSQPGVSKQLANLKRLKLITYSKVGKWNYYKMNPEFVNNGSITSLISRLPGLVDEKKLIEADRAALKACVKKQKETGNCNMESFVGIRAKIGL